MIVSDAHGNEDELFEPRFVPKIRTATYDFVFQDTVYIVVPDDQTYSITFESNKPLMVLEIVKGRGSASPDEAIRYRDLALARGKAKFEITPHGVEPLRVDTNHDGRFETLVEPTAKLSGLAARDTKGPEFRFQIVDRSATTILISIEAIDRGTGLKSFYYSLDGQNSFPYQSPVRVDLKQTSFIWAFAEDYAANRSAYKYDLGGTRK